MVSESDDREFVVEDNIIKCFDPVYKPDPRGLAYELFEAMKYFRNNVAQYIVDTGEVDTYGDFHQRCTRTAIKMKLLGVTRDDVICISSSGHKNTCVPYVAAILMGAKVTCVDPYLSAQDTGYLLQIVKPKLIFSNCDNIRVLQEVLKDKSIEATLISFEDSKHMSFNEFLKPDKEEQTFEPARPDSLDETAIIIFSSGTTGLPKGVRISHKTMMVRSAEYINMYQTNCRPGLGNYDTEALRENLIIISYSSLYWISATLVLMISFISGSARVIHSKFYADDLWRLICKYKITAAFFTATQTVELAGTEKPKNVDTSTLKYLLTGGAPIAPSVFINLRKKLPSAWIAQGYGCSEIGGVLIRFNPQRSRDAKLLDKKPRSCGGPVSGMWYKVVDLETQALLGPNQKGELLIKSETVTTGYYNNESLSPVNKDGWLATGDLVYYDDDYCFYIVDRLKQMLKYKLYQICPSVIEDIVLQHPAVKEAVAIGLPHPEYGDLITVVVVLYKNLKNVDPEDLRKFVDDQVDDVKKLRGGVKFVKELPMTISGKVKRLELKQMIMSNII